MVKGRERRFIARLRTCCGKRRVSIFSHLPGTDMSFSFEKTKNTKGRGTKVLHN
jgi:hypothetical protein